MVELDTNTIYESAYVDGNPQFGLFSGIVKDP